MGEGLREPARVTWLRDARTPARRLRASWHSEAGVVVLSLWSGDLCTATFRLPIEDAPELMHVLIDAFADPNGPPLPEEVGVHKRMWSRLRARFRRRPVAPVLPLRRPD
jgi:hypothetical protein